MLTFQLSQCWFEKVFVSFLHQDCGNKSGNAGCKIKECNFTAMHPPGLNIDYIYIHKRGAFNQPRLFLKADCSWRICFIYTSVFLFKYFQCLMLK